MRPNSKSALVFIYLTLLIDVIGLGIIYPVMPRMISRLIHSDLSLAAQYGGWLMFLYSLMQFFFAPILGSLSDQYGRRLVILLSLFGFGIDYLFLGFAPTIVWLFIGRSISGITGASFTTANAYIADCSTDENRTKNFGKVGAMFGLGFIIGPSLGGILSHYGDRIPFFFSAGLAFLNFIFGLFVLPESLPLENRRKFHWVNANPMVSIFGLKAYPKAFKLVIALFCIYFADQATQSIWTYYTMEKFKWGTQLVGYSLAYVGVLIVLVQGFLVQWFTKKMGVKKSIFLGCILSALGFLSIALATKGWMLFVFLWPFALGGIAGASIKSAITEDFPANKQGELQGSLTSILSISTILGPIFMTYIFSYFTRKNGFFYFPGAPFFTASLLLVASGLFSFWSFRAEKT